MKEILNSRFEALNILMNIKALDAILLLTPGMGNLDLWILGEDHVPTPAPFNRNSAFLLFKGEDDVIRLCQTTTHPTDRAQYKHFEDAGLDDRLAGCSVGVVHPDTMKKNVRDYLDGLNPQVRLQDVTEAFEEVKAVKTGEDRVSLKAAAKEYDKLFAAMPLMLRPGRLESEVVNEIRQRLSWQGAESETPGFHSMVWLTSSPDGAESVKEPIQWPGRRLAEGDRINITIKGYIKGSAAALGRSFVLGSASEEAEGDWDLAVKAQQLAASMAVPGAALKEISDAVRGFLKDNGLEDDASGWIHGIGTSVYEAPRNIGSSADMKLKEGMVLAIGPEAKPFGKDAYCCVDVYAVAPGGAERITSIPQEIRNI